MRIEVIVAHYNGSAFIAEQIRSIQSGELPKGCTLQLTVIDDFSKPEEFEKLQVLAARWPNVRLQRNAQNLGVIRTFERGLRESTGDYVLLSDQDDVWLPNKIVLSFEKMRAIEEGKPALVFTNLRTVDQRLNTLNHRMLIRDFDPDQERASLLFQNVVTGCTMMLNRALVEFALPFPAALPMHDHWLAVCAAFAGQLGYVSEPTILYRQHANNLVGQPNRLLSARLQKPWQTIRQFNRGLALKAEQAQELARRLPEGASKELVLRCAEAFQRRNVRNLRALVKDGVIKTERTAGLLLSALYLAKI